MMYVTFNLSNPNGLIINIDKNSTIHNLRSMVNVVLAVYAFSYGFQDS